MGVTLTFAESEAMWVHFTSSSKCMIKIYAGGINTISGESAKEDGASVLRRQKKLAEHQSKGSTQNPRLASPLQDYVVVPHQPWLDGIADSDGTVRQFVAMPVESGHSIEHQLTGSDATGGLQFEITPYLKPPVALQDHPHFPEGDHVIEVKTLTGKRITLNASPDYPIWVLKSHIQDKEGIPDDQQRLIWAGKQMEDSKTVHEYGIPSVSASTMILSLLARFLTVCRVLQST
jgi:hypothetical protein